MKRSALIMVITVLTIILTISSFSRRAQAQPGHETPRGIFGDILDTVKLHSLVENMYSFRNRVFYKGGPDSELLNWLIPRYRGFSETILKSPLWPIKLVFIPAAVVVSSIMPLYPQIGLVGIALASGLLTGMIYILPLFLIIEIFSKTGLVAVHGKTMLKILSMLFAASAILLLVAYGYPNALLLFSSYSMLIFTLWFTWFLPIVLYYRS